MQHQVHGTASGVPESRTFYKRTLPCPPAVAFSSSEGGEPRRCYTEDELHECSNAAASQVKHCLQTLCWTAPCKASSSSLSSSGSPNLWLQAARDMFCATTV